MKTKKIISSGIQLLLVIIILLYKGNNNVYAQTCWPCSAETSAVQIASRIYERASTALANAEEASSKAADEFYKIQNIEAIAASAVVLACGLAWQTPLCEHAVNFWFTAKIDLNKAAATLQRCLSDEAQKRADKQKALAVLLAKQAELAACIARPADPCKKCVDGNVVDKCPPNVLCCFDGRCIDKNGCCPECPAGQKCCNSRCIDANDCCPPCSSGEQCCDGVCIGTDECCPPCSSCQQCINGVCVYLCTSDQQCCNGVCEPIKYEYTVTVTIVNCGGSNSYSYPSSSCLGGYTDDLEYSFGVCIRGSKVNITCSGPYPVPCP